MTQIFDTLSERWFKVIKIYAATKLETVLVNLLKVMTVFRFYAKKALSHVLTCLSLIRCFKRSTFTGKLRASFSHLATKTVVLVECEEDEDKHEGEIDRIY